MLACTYVGKGRFALTEKEKPTLQHPQDAIVRVTLANQGLTRIPDGVSDEQALLVGDVLATGYWAAKISDVTEEDTPLITHTFKLKDIEEAYDLFENRRDGVIKVAVKP